MEKTIIRRHYNLDKATFPDDMDPLLARIYCARGINNIQELEHTLKRLLDYRTIKGIQAAAEILADAIVHQNSLLIVGDFDCDGATSTAVGMLALQSMGGNVRFLVPNRFDFGYGLTPEIVEEATKHNTPDVLITVDNGISSLEGVRVAKEKGIKVIITDHHLAGKQLPEADVIVNPNQPGCPFPGKNSAGVSVIFYLMCVLLSSLRQQNWFHEKTEPKLAELLDLVALGTVADVVSLDNNNRILVSQGLARIRAGYCRPGISALIHIANRHQKQLTTADLGFALGPRLNAAGRLDDMSLGITLLLTNDPSEAHALAQQLDELNQDRKSIEQSMQAEALSVLKNIPLNQHHELPWGISLYNRDWHQGVIGILASRIKEQFNRPVVAFADADNDHVPNNSDQEIKGSARSISGLHIRDTLADIHSHHPDLIIKFGGHAMAAGLTLKKQDLPLFETSFNQAVKKRLSADDLKPVLLTDGLLKSSEITLERAHQLQTCAPWGQNFPEPCFDGCFHIVQQRLVGKKHLKLVLQAPDSSQLIDAIAFNIDTDIWPSPAVTALEAVYTLSVNEYRGEKNIQLIINYLKPRSSLKP
ncbi:Single-stranded-DNA-specific exonuclease RecJ [invertebrate metagenome]|uniref:Single-stranded-DNA-specific exonuclease RecJ n=1 Tax=invertebrate metagenome TaxID=1711999 RepID=A0A2H9TAY2_9ZZZZ